MAAYIAGDSLLTMRSLTSNYGSRHTFFQITRDVSAGEKITSSDFTRYSMFTHDAPDDAVTSKNSPEGFFTQYALAKGSIVTKHMISKNAIALDDEHRVVFVPTDEVYSEAVSSTADLLSVSADGYSSDYVARGAHILFDLSEEDIESSSPHGYFVKVTQDEAEEIIFALSTGDVRFAFASSNR